MVENNKKIDNAEALSSAFSELRKAGEEFSAFSQCEVDRIFRKAATCACKERLHLAKEAFFETGMGVLEDKVIKNAYAAEYIFDAYKNTKTCGVIEEDKAYGIKKIAEPVGVIAAVVPTTNPTSTAIFKCLLALKTRNAIILSPHPRAKKCTIEAARIVAEAAVAAGAPKGIIRWIDEPSAELTQIAMSEADLILATGGPGLVRAAYSSGKPAIGVGSGNTPAVIDESADVKLAVNSIIHSKKFDNGMICASEQAVIACKGVYEEAKREFSERGCYFLTEGEADALRGVMFNGDSPNPEIVGRSACKIAEIAGFSVPENTGLLIGEVLSADYSEEFAHEKLAPILAMYKAEDFEHAVELAEKLIANGGYGHTSSVFLNTMTESEKLEEFSRRMRTCRVLVNTPAAQGGIGGLYNFKLAPSLTLGCGSRGGNSVSENVGVRHLLNIKTVAERRENMLWFRAPEKIYVKKGCLPSALDELKSVMNKKRAFIVTDSFLYKNGFAAPIEAKLNELGMAHTCYFDIEPDPLLSTAKRGAEAMNSFNPDCIIAFGGGSAMDAAKVMWVLYENPDADFSDMAMRFADIRKRVFSFPQMGRKAYFVAIPTSAGTGSEVTPFSVITDDESGIKYPLADYELMPDMAVIDVDYHMSAPKMLTAASGIDALSHAVEAYASMLATDYTDSLAIGALKQIFEYLPRAFDNGESDVVAREKTANAATMAGMAFANAFLGICHSMAHKLGARFKLPHGVSNALLLEHVMRFNAEESPVKMGTFPQYSYPHTVKRYAELAGALGFGGENDDECFESLIAEINRLKEKIGIKRSICDYGVSEQEFLGSVDELSEAAFDDQCTGANPRYPLIDEIKKIYLAAYYGAERL